MTTIIYICGAYCLLFVLFHLGFWKIFGWGKDLKNLSDIKRFNVDRRIMHILNVQLIWCFIAVACICFIFPTELVGSGLGRAFLASCSLFWLIRTVMQFIFFRKRSGLNYILTVLFVIGAALFALPVLL